MIHSDQNKKKLSHIKIKIVENTVPTYTYTQQLKTKKNIKTISLIFNTK